jgi:hypothetical protein
MLNSIFNLEPMVGLEPTAVTLQKFCTSFVLHRQNSFKFGRGRENRTHYFCSYDLQRYHPLLLCKEIFHCTLPQYKLVAIMGVEPNVYGL